MQIYLQQKLGQVSEARKAKGVKRKIWLSLTYNPGQGLRRSYEFLHLFIYEKMKKFNFELEGAYQSGTFPDLTDISYLYFKSTFKFQCVYSGYFSICLHLIQFLKFAAAL